MNDRLYVAHTKFTRVNCGCKVRMVSHVTDLDTARKYAQEHRLIFNRNRDMYSTYTQVIEVYDSASREIVATISLTNMFE